MTASRCWLSSKISFHIMLASFGLKERNGWKIRIALQIQASNKSCLISVSSRSISVATSSSSEQTVNFAGTSLEVTQFVFENGVAVYSYTSAEADQPFIHNIITRFDSGTNKPLPPPLLLAHRHPARVHLHLLRPRSQTSLAKFYKTVTQKTTICMAWCPDRNTQSRSSKTNSYVFWRTSLLCCCSNSNCIPECKAVSCFQNGGVNKFERTFAFGPFTHKESYGWVLLSVDRLRDYLHYILFESRTTWGGILLSVELLKATRSLGPVGSGMIWWVVFVLTAFSLSQ